ncbi:MAG TPA: hypothetical protein GXX51_12455 [Firmicutes bacterium]|nr:hypothetical protein [Bacillota bacterium]
MASANAPGNGDCGIPIAGEHDSLRLAFKASLDNGFLVLVSGMIIFLEVYLCLVAWFFLGPVGGILSVSGILFPTYGALYSVLSRVLDGRRFDIGGFVQDLGAYYGRCFCLGLTGYLLVSAWFFTAKLIMTQGASWLLGPLVIQTTLGVLFAVVVNYFFVLMVRNRVRFWELLKVSYVLGFRNGVNTAKMLVFKGGIWALNIITLGAFLMFSTGFMIFFDFYEIRLSLERIKTRA